MMKTVRNITVAVHDLLGLLPRERPVQTVLDGAYVKETNLTKRVVPYPHLREADVMYVRRIWQDIDLRQKINQMFYFPVDPIEDRKNLFDVIRYASGSRRVIDRLRNRPAGKDDEFRYPFSASQVDSMLNPPSSFLSLMPVTGEVIGSMEAKTSINSQDIVRYRIKEDWVWDRQAQPASHPHHWIAPIIEKKDDEGNSQGLAPLFWLYYPECRYVFANAECYNYANDAQRRTFEEIFQKRYFSSYIIKETNVFDRSINDYAQGLDALLESQRIKDELFTIEHDLWHY